MTEIRNQLKLFDLAIEKKNDSTDSDGEIKIRPETYKGIYAMHKYWSKKPGNLVAHYIEKYSNRGETILDPFCGSGVSVIESVRMSRRAIGIDINPVAVFSTEMALQHIDIRVMNREFGILKREIEPRINELYYSRCPNCDNPEAVITHTIWEDDEPTELWMTCSACMAKKVIKSPSMKDVEVAKSEIDSSAWFPTDELIENSRINAKTGMRVCDLFTPRALAALSILLQRIREIEDTDIRKALEFCFSAALPQASNMVFVIRRRGKMNGDNSKGKAEVGSWVIGYWIPNEHFEINVWRCFENRFRRIIKGKRQVNAVIPRTVNSKSSFEELNQSEAGYWVTEGTATDIQIPSETIDYIFTDPPHGNRIPYLELSLMWNSWLGFRFDWNDEIIVSEARSRQKGARDYYQRLRLAFDEMHRVLKTKKYLSVAFNSLDDDTWLSLLNALLDTGFDIVEISPLEYSARSVVQDSRKNALKTDFVITCQKQISKSVNSVSFCHSQADLEKAIYEFFSNRTDGGETYEIINHLLIRSIPTGEVFMVSMILDTLEKMYYRDNGKWKSKLS